MKVMKECEIEKALCDGANTELRGKASAGKKNKLGTKLKWVLFFFFFFSVANYLSQYIHIWVMKKTRSKTFCRFFKWTSCFFCSYFCCCCFFTSSWI